MADAAEWARRVAEWRRSGETAAEFVRGRDFAASTLKYWSSELNRRRRESATSTSMALIRVERSAPREEHVASVELDGAVVRVMAGADEATLSALFGALRSGR